MFRRRFQFELSLMCYNLIGTQVIPRYDFGLQLRLDSNTISRSTFGKKSMPSQFKEYK